MIPNLLLGAFITAFAGYFLWEAAALPSRARMFPQAVLWGMATVGLLILVQAVASRLRETEPGGTGALASTLIWQIAIPGGMLVLTYVLLTFFGFYLSVPVLLVSLYLFHIYRAAPGTLTAATVAWSFAFAAIATLAMYGLFTLLLGLPAPSGVLF
jgi:putative tricarboxylic transport membrane protein